MDPVAAFRVDIEQAVEGTDLRGTVIAAEGVVAAEAAAAAVTGEGMLGEEEEGATDPLTTWGLAMTAMWVRVGISNRIIMRGLGMGITISLLFLRWVAETVLATVGFRTKG